LKPLLVIFLIVCLMSTRVAAQNSVGERAYRLSMVIQQQHFSPKPVDDSLSRYIYDEILHTLDPYQIYFSAKSLTELSVWKYQLDDEIKGPSIKFLLAVSESYNKELASADQSLKILLQQSFSFTEPDTLHLFHLPETVRTSAMIKKRLTQVFKWRMLEELQSFGESNGKTLNAALIKTDDGATRQKLGKQWESFYKSQVSPTGEVSPVIEKLYLSAIASYQDPHTEFMEDETKRVFEDDLSSESRIFGFSVDTDEDGNYIVDGIVPGSAAFHSSSVHENDKIVSIKTKDGKIIRTKDATAEEIRKLIGHDQESVELTLETPDGLVKDVKLNKSIVRKEENVVRGWVMDGKSRIGYISLPIFYTRMVDGVGTSCAEDVAREIVKLKKENIQGLILDLRYNGGGSMEEAASLLGIFVDIGPLGMVRVLKGKAEIIKDVNRGQIWDGPMAVMINGASASASELVAATLQDYRKAVIVGSPSFGKATMQVIIPVDTTLNLESIKDPKELEAKGGGDYVKMTIGRLYRVTGGSTQRVGVSPDLYLPDRFEMLDITERGYPTALHPDSAGRTVSYTQSQPKFNPAQLANFNENVVSKDSALAAVKQMITHQKSNRAGNAIPLDWKGFNAYREKGPTGNPLYRNTMITSRPSFVVKNSSMDAAYNAMEKYQKENDDATMATLSADIYLRQAFQLIDTIIQSKK